VRAVKRDKPPMFSIHLPPPIRRKSKVLKTARVVNFEAIPDFFVVQLLEKSLGGREAFGVLEGELRDDVVDMFHIQSIEFARPSRL